MSTHTKGHSVNDSFPSPTGSSTSSRASEEPLLPWAVGMVMAMTPCAQRDAQRILAAAAEAAHTTPSGLAAAMVAGSRGAAVPTHLRRALRRAMEVARTPPLSPGDRPRGVALTPSHSRTEKALSELRTYQAVLAAAPSNTDARRMLDDAAYTLCVLLGKTTLHDAVLSAEQRLAAPA